MSASVAEVLFVLPWLERVQLAHYSSLASERAVPAAEGNVWTAYEVRLAPLLPPAPTTDQRGSWPQVYRSRTSPIIPLPPSVYGRLPAGVRRWVFGERSLDSTAARRFAGREAETGVEC